MSQERGSLGKARAATRWKSDTLLVRNNRSRSCGRLIDQRVIDNPTRQGLTRREMTSL